ncbi:MAG: DUF1028 domain-containing protein [Acuticoccus sp.]
MTFSIAARCARTGLVGMAVSSSSPAVAARCAHARARVGAVASQNITDPDLGPQILDRLAAGEAAEAALAAVLATHPFADFRQITVIDSKGGTALHTGAGGLGTTGASRGVDCVAAGNLLSDAAIAQRMTETFAATAGHLGDRLLAAMQASVDAGGEEGPVRSAGMLIYDRQPWPIVDLRVDWDEAAAPIAGLRAVWAIYKPQIDDYVVRAENPTAAPGYGVPGDE